MTYSKYACDTCDATAEPNPENLRIPPTGWESFNFIAPPNRDGFSSVLNKDVCPDCVRRPFGDLLAVLREKQEKTS